MVKIAFIFATCCIIGIYSAVIPQDFSLTNQEQYPWHAGIYSSEHKSLICGGSIISPRVIVTAAHCVADIYGNPIAASNFLVAVGKNYRDYSDPRDGTAQYPKISKISISPDFTGHFKNHFASDIALIILEQALTDTQHINPIAVNLNGQLGVNQLKGAVGKVAGWDLYNQDKKEVVEMDLPYISNEVCLKGTHDSFKPYVTPDKFCAGDLNGPEVCFVTSGSGLRFKSNDGKNYLEGIVSVAPHEHQSDDTNCRKAPYVAFTAISKHADFIKDIINDNA